MERLILPGFSAKNKIWAEEIKENLGAEIPTVVINWAHWETGQAEKGWIGKEAEKILQEYEGQKVNLIAKSVGTAVAMAILRKPNFVDKLILCGVPLLDLDDEDKKYYEVLKDFPTDQILCIQNSDDNHGTYEEVKAFLASINPQIPIITKPRSDHEYPYPDDFRQFLK